MVYLLISVYVYLFLGVFYYAKKRPLYSHLRDSISELGENGSEYEKQVGFWVFMPVGLACFVIAGLTYSDSGSAGMLLGAMGFGYFFSAFFPCDPGTPMVGSWKNSTHNLVGGFAYVTMVYQLKELIDLQVGWFVEVAFILLSVFLLNFIIGWPKHLVGLTQRVAETSVFVSIFCLLQEMSL